MSPAHPPPKPCVVCGRPIEWRKKWERDWDAVRCCSRACRAARNDPTAQALEAAILELLGARAADATICPSEAAKRVRPDDWRPLMEDARRAARRLALDGRARIRQQGHVVDPGTFTGPIRIGRG